MTVSIGLAQALGNSMAPGRTVLSSPHGSAMKLEGLLAG
jgi:hypothetical protein